MLRVFWEAAGAVDERGAAARDERTRMRFGEPEEVVQLWEGAGLRGVEGGEIVVSAAYERFDDLWEPFTRGVGPCGGVMRLRSSRRRCQLFATSTTGNGSALLRAPSSSTARAWYAVGRK